MNKKILSVFSLLALLGTPLTAVAVPGGPSFKLSVSESINGSCVDLKNNMIISTSDSRTGGEVSLLQGLLIDKGYLHYTKTGTFGAMTKAAVLLLQKEYGLTPSGYVGPQTRAKIKGKECKRDTIVLPIGVSVILNVLPPDDPYLISIKGDTSITVPSAYKGKVILFYGDNTSELVTRTSQELFKKEFSHSYNIDNEPKEYDVILALTESSAQGDFEDYDVFKNPLNSKNTIIVKKHVSITRITPLSINAAIDTMAYTTATPTISGMAIGGGTTSSLVRIAITSQGGKKVFEKNEIPVVNGRWYVVVSTVLQSGTYTAELYTADGRKLVSEPFTVNLPTHTSSGTLDTSGTAKLEQYIGESVSYAFNISYQAALSNCQTNATNNPERMVRCVWGGKEIYNRAGKSATIDQVTLTTSSHNPTFTGSATDIDKVGIVLFSKNVENSGTMIYGSSALPYYVSVRNGRWSFSASTTSLGTGSYEMYIKSPTNLLLTSGTIVITQ